MKNYTFITVFCLISFIPGFAQKSNFNWPEHKKMALSLTFDDGRQTQLTNGIPLFGKYNIKATFYISPNAVKAKLNSWKKAIQSGHEIGNHTINHPCTGNYLFARNEALEDYTLEEIKAELDSANRIIKEMLGVTPVSFAYPCGQKFIGRGTGTKSYVPVVSAKFESGRGWRDERPNDAAYCDMSQISGIEMDGKTFTEIKKYIDYSQSNGLWLVLAGHEIGSYGSDSTHISMLDSLCRYVNDPANGIWCDNIHNIASWINKQRDITTFSEVPAYLNPTNSLEVRIEDLLSRMTLKEKIGQLNMPYPHEMASDLQGMIDATRKFAEGKLIPDIGPAGGFWAPSRILKEATPMDQCLFMNELQKIAVEKTRLKIPLLFFEEGTHGLIEPGGTVFPEGLAIGSTFNTDLAGRIYGVVATEARARSIHHLGTIVVEPNRDPRMGRNEECYSEDPYLCSSMIYSIVRSMQGDDVSANDRAIPVLSHFPGQSQPVSGLERGNLEVSERTLRQVFLPPWVAGIQKAGALSLMATYVTVDDDRTHGSEKLLTKILREEMGFKGIVVCEGDGMDILVYENMVSTLKEAGEYCIKAGIDVNIWNEDGYMNALMENVQEGKVSVETIDRSVRRILRVKFMLGLFESPYADPLRAQKEANTKEHRELAREAARQGIVLLKNDHNTLPLKKTIKRIAVIGPNADPDRNQLGDYNSRPVTQEVVTVLEGIRNKMPQAKITYVKGCDIMGEATNEIKKAKDAAKNADIAIVVVGENGEITNGEDHDVVSLDLSGRQEELLKEVYSTGTPVVAVLINGRPLSIRWTAENIPAIVEAWMCGEEGGNAIADVLFGDYNPGGHLAITFPRHVGQLPVYYNYKPSKKYWVYGYGKPYIDMPATPLYEFGFGLSYTTFEYSNLQLSKDTIGQAGEIYVTADIKNTGNRDGSEVVQLYLNDELTLLSRPYIELKGFERIFLLSGESKTVIFRLTPEQLSYLDRDLKPVVEPGTFNVFIGSSSKDIRLKGKFEVRER